jgi:hypothetical protein
MMHFAATELVSQTPGNEKITTGFVEYTVPTGMVSCVEGDRSSFVVFEYQKIEYGLTPFPMPKSIAGGPVIARPFMVKPFVA